MATASEIPLRLRNGEQAEWTKSLSDFPASTWNAAYELVSSGGTLSVAGVADGDDFDFEITTTESAAMGIGRYDFRLVVDDGAGVVRVICEGEIEILEAADIAPADTRSHARIMLENIRAVLEGRITKDHESFTIAGRAITRIPILELEQLEQGYAGRVEKEERRERRLRGEHGVGQIAARLP